MFALSSCRLSAFHLARLYSFICPCSSVRLYPPAAFRANRLLSRRSPPSPSCVHAEAARRARWETAAAVRADRTLERHAPSSTLCSRPDPLRCPPRADDDVFFAKYATHPSTLRLGWSLSESMRYPMLSFFYTGPLQRASSSRPRECPSEILPAGWRKVVHGRLAHNPPISVPAHTRQSNVRRGGHKATQRDIFHEHVLWTGHIHPGRRKAAAALLNQNDYGYPGLLLRSETAVRVMLSR